MHVRKLGKLVVWSMNDLAFCVDGMINNDFDCIMIVEGKRGIGKSTLVYKLAKKLKSIQKFRPHRDLCYSRKQVIEQLTKRKKGFIFADEMINVTYNRDFYVEDQKVLLKGLNMYRDSCNVFAGCIPEFIDLDVQFRRMCKIRITVIRRGIALIQTQRKTIYSADPWDMKLNQKIEDKWSMKGTKNPRYSQLTTVRGIIKFGDLRPAQKLLYKNIKEKKRNRVFESEANLKKEESPEVRFYNNIYNLVKNRSLTPNEFNMSCITFGIKDEVVKKRIRRMLRDEGIKDDMRQLVNVVNSKVRKKADLLGFTNV